MKANDYLGSKKQKSIMKLCVRNRHYYSLFSGNLESSLEVAMSIHEQIFVFEYHLFNELMIRFTKSSE